MGKLYFNDEAVINSFVSILSELSGFLEDIHVCDPSILPQKPLRGLHDL